ncbi:MAG: hypothetical protein WKG07_08595 [Hymenobacter sp.]
MPYATIRRCVVGEQPNPAFPQQQPLASYRPLLREVLAATEAACLSAGRPPVGYSVELKSSPAGDSFCHPRPLQFVELVLAELAVAGVLSRTTLLSFDRRILQAARQLLPVLPVCLLSEEPTPANLLFEQLGFVPDTFGPDFRLLSLGVVQGLATRYPHLRLSTLDCQCPPRPTPGNRLAGSRDYYRLPRRFTCAFGVTYSTPPYCKSRKADKCHKLFCYIITTTLHLSLLCNCILF